MVERVPITEPDEVFVLDEAEMIDGYNDGRANESCGDNRSTAYWHGWRNGLVDGGHWKGDDAQRILANKLVKDGRLRLRGEPDDQSRRGPVYGDDPFPEPTKEQLAQHERRVRHIVRGVAKSEDIEVQEGE